MPPRGNQTAPAPSRRWLTPEETLEYLKNRFSLDYSLGTLYKKSSRDEIPVERPGGRGGPIRFDPDKLDAWARGEWSTEARERVLAETEVAS